MTNCDRAKGVRNSLGPDDYGVPWTSRKGRIGTGTLCQAPSSFDVRCSIFGVMISNKEYAEITTAPLQWLPILPPRNFCKRVGWPGDTNKQRYRCRLLCDEDTRVSTILQPSEFPVRYRAPYSNCLCHRTTRLVNCLTTKVVMMKCLARP